MTQYPGEIPFKDTQVGFIDNFDDAQEFMRWLGERRDVLGFDTETSGISPYDPGARIRLAQFGDVNTGWTIDAQRWGGLVEEVLNRYEGEFVLHNCAFDYKWISVHMPDVKIPWSRTHDTMIQHRLHDSEESAALKTVSVKYFGNAAVAGQKALSEGMQKQGWTWDTVPLDFAPYSQYAALDVILTARLHRRMSHVHSGQFQRAYVTEMEARRICTNMELRGMRIDKERVTKRRHELEEYVEKSQSYCRKMFGVNIGSTKQLGEWFQANDAPLTEFTATGLPKMDKDTLENLTLHGFELAKYALNARKAEKIVGTYLENMLKFAGDGDIIRPNINTLVARTGRMSITDPALQTLPSSDKNVRPSFIPFEGEKLISADYDQQELRLIAGLSQDDAMLNAFRTADTVGPDFFTNSARSIYSDETIVKKDPRRSTIKTYWYSSAYGAGVEKQALSAGVPVDDMRQIVSNVESEYHVMTNWKGQVTRRINSMISSGERPYVELFDGRRIYVNPDKPYVGVNYTIQGSCAVMMKQSLINLDYAGLGDYMCLPVHDEILFSIPEHEIDDLRPVIAEAMYNGDFGVDISAAADAPMSRWVKQ